MQQYSMVN